MPSPTSLPWIRRTAATCCLCLPSLLAGQTAAREAAREAPRDTAGIPKGMIPPVGMCRVWVQGVPATQQPAPTDCATALRQKATNARVVWGPRTMDGRPTRLETGSTKRNTEVAERPAAPTRTSAPAARPAQGPPPSAAPARVPATATVRTPPQSPPAAKPTPETRKKPELP